MVARKSALLTLAILVVPSIISAQNPPHLWSQSFGDPTEQVSAQIAVDGSNNIVVVGYFEGTVDFGGGSFTSAGGADIFVAKYDSDGNHIWSGRFGGQAHDLARSVTTDLLGSTIVVGEFSGSIDFGGGILTSEGGLDIFVAKFASDGTHLWSQRFGSDMGDDEAWSAAFDGTDNVLVTGYFDSWVDFGGGMLPQGDHDIFVVKFNSDGNHLWSNGFGDANDFQYSQCITVDPSENIIITGRFQGTIDFGGGSLVTEGREDILLAKFDANGNHMWSTRFGDNQSDVGQCVSVASSGDIVLTGHFSRSVDFGGGAMWSAGGADVFLSKFSPNGNHIWSRRFGDLYYQQANSVFFDPWGNITVAGQFEGIVDFGGGHMISAGYFDVFVASYDASGNHIWSQQFGDWPSQYGTSVVVDGSANTIISGHYDGTVDFGGGELTSVGGNDVFLAKFGYGTVPTQLQSFDARYQDTGVEITWELSDVVSGVEFITSRKQVSDSQYREMPISVYCENGVSYKIVDSKCQAGRTYQYRVDLSDGNGRWILFETIPVSIPSTSFALYRNYPNPFNPQTTIEYSIPSSQVIDLSVYDAQGRLVNTLQNGLISEGQHDVIWDGRNASGAAVASGMYFVRLESDRNVKTMKILLLK